LFGLETYWAPVTTLVITQSSFGATLAVSWQRFISLVFGLTELLIDGPGTASVSALKL
jgi:uncharacterized membrane protein YccC